MEQLNGSEKQIAWATDIREKMINGLCQPNGRVVTKGMSQHIELAQRAVDKSLETGRDPERKQAKLNDLNKIMVAIENIDSAEWFISNQNILTGMMMWVRRYKEIVGTDDAEFFTRPQ